MAPIHVCYPDFGFEGIEDVRLIKSDEGGGLIVFKGKGCWHRVPVEFLPTNPPPSETIRDTIAGYLAE